MMAHRPQSNEVRQRLAQSQLRVDRKDDRDCARHPPDRARLRQAPRRWNLRELSLAIDTGNGIVLVVGCFASWHRQDCGSGDRDQPRIHFIVGGFHLVVSKDPDIENIVMTLRDKFKVAYVAARSLHRRADLHGAQEGFGDRYLYAGWARPWRSAPRLAPSLEQVSKRPLSWMRTISGATARC